MEQKKYTFTLSLQEAQMIIFALKDRPMKDVEHIVANMDNQFATQMKAEQEAAQKAQKEADEAKAAAVTETPTEAANSN